MPLLRKLRPRNHKGATGRVGIVCVVLTALAVAACHRAPAEQQISASIAKAAAAARTGDAGGVLAAVTDDFSGNDGALDRRGLRQLLALRTLRQDRTGVLVGPVSFERHAGRVLARFNLVLTGGQPGGLLPQQSAVYSMRTAWRSERGEWKCYSASWREGLAGD